VPIILCITDTDDDLYLFLSIRNALWYFKSISLCIVEFPPLFVCVFKTTYHKANKNDCELQNYFTHSSCFVHTVNAFTWLASLSPNNLVQAAMTVKLFFREFLGWNLGRYSGCNVWRSSR